MQLTIYRHMWGISEPWETVLPKLKSGGLYAGIECSLPSRQDMPRWRELFAANGFRYAAQAFTGGKTVAEHLQSLRDQCTLAKELSADFVNVHSGVDHWPLADGIAFFRDALAVAGDLGIAVHHETHRGRILFNPRDTLAVLDAVPALTLTADYSHWVVTCESLLPGHPEWFARIAPNVRHIHARVGYEEGPQVPDPRAPEYQRHVEAHERWWDQIWASRETAGATEMTLTPEFGPPGYLHTLPYTDVPVADLWAICDWQAQRQIQRFNSQRTGTVRATRR